MTPSILCDYCRRPDKTVMITIEIYFSKKRRNGRKLKEKYYWHRSTYQAVPIGQTLRPLVYTNHIRRVWSGARIAWTKAARNVEYVWLVDRHGQSLAHTSSGIDTLNSPPLGTNPPLLIASHQPHPPAHRLSTTIAVHSPPFHRVNML